MAATMLESITEKLTFPFPWWQMSLSNLYQVVFFIIAAYISYLVVRSIYLLTLHPLAKYPGPRLAAVSKVWFARSMYNGKYFQDVDKLHQQYGPIVRTAPNELSFATLQSYHDIYNTTGRTQTVFPKSNFYQDHRAEPAIALERDVHKHKEVRRVLAPAFTTAACVRQEPRVKEHIDAFVAQIKRHCSKEALNMTEWWKYVTFDITGDLTFGEPFGTIKEAKNHFWISTIHDTGKIWLLIILCRDFPILWILVFLLVPKDLRAAQQRHEAFTKEKVRNRIARNSEIKHIDFFTNLLSERSRDQSERFMLSQATFLVIAGSDTMSLFLTGLTYFLLTNPSKLRLLQDEIRTTFANVSEINHKTTVDLQYLNAAIEEGHRLTQSVPLGLTRESPGAMVDGHYVPKGTVVSTASWTVAHSAKYFADPYEFHPERWLPKTHPEYNARYAGDSLNASQPFSLGPRSCLGMRLAYLESRLLIAKLIYVFDWELTNGDKIDWLKDIKMTGFMSLPDVYVKFSPRPAA